MDGPARIARRVYDCLEAFSTCQQRLEATGRKPIQAHIDRFNTWIDDIGALAKWERASLDYRLQEAPELADSLLDMIDVLEVQLRKILMFPPQPRPGYDSTSRIQSAIACSIENPELEDRDVAEQLQSVDDTIDWLFKFSRVIRRTKKQNDPLSRAAQFPIRSNGLQGKEITLEFDQFVHNVLKTRLPSINDGLRNRLAAAICLRRRFFLYRERHQMKLALRVEEPNLLGPEKRPSVNVQEETVSELTPEPHAGQRAPQVPSVVISGTEVSQKVDPHTPPPIPNSSPPVRNSQSPVRHLPPPSSANSSWQGYAGDAEIPPPPTLESGQREHQCPYCKQTLPEKFFTSTIYWRRHVIADLRPYVCIHEQCPFPVEYFSSSREWREHLRKPHLTEWVCPIHVEPDSPGSQETPNAERTKESRVDPFNSQEDLETHMKCHHSSTFSINQISILARRSARTVRVIDRCLLCEEWNKQCMDSEEPLADLALYKHIAEHLLTISLMSLPFRDDVDKGNYSDASQKLQSGNTQRSNAVITLSSLSTPSVDDEAHTSLMGSGNVQTIGGQGTPLQISLLEKLEDTSGQGSHLIVSTWLQNFDESAAPGDGFESLDSEKRGQALLLERPAFGTTPVQPDHHNAIQEFLMWFESAKVQGQASSTRTDSIDNYFVPFPKVSGFFKGSRPYHNILDALWPDKSIPIHPEGVAQDYATVFCILLYIRKGHYIEKFARDDDLSDRKLPFTAMPSTFPVLIQDEDFFGDFFRAQWHFCAPAFKYRMERRFGPNHILPIIHKQLLGNGGSAQTFQIIVAKAYDQLEPTTGDERARDQRHAHTYALKTFHTRDAAEYYRKESRAYSLVAPHRSAGLLNYYGCFEHDGSYNLLLEFADEGTLEGYFEKHEPPQTAQDIYDFWCGMLGLAEAVLRVHSAGEEVSLDRWHQYMKPEKILVVSGGRRNHNAFRFKLGLSHFKKSKGKESTDRDTYGKRTYGAPECFRVDGVVGSLNISVKQKVDIWSLGCVWSEAAAWVISGKHGLYRYRANRTEAAKRMEPFTNPGRFHDGTKMLDVVTNEHWKILNMTRHYDFVTKPVLDVVEDMLATNPDARPTSKFLYEKTVKIRREAAIQVKQKFTGSNSINAASSSLTESIPFPIRTSSQRLQHQRIFSDLAMDFCESPRTMTPDWEYSSTFRPISEADIPSSPPARPPGPNHDESTYVTRPPSGPFGTRRSPPPYLSVSTALKWINERKTYSSFGSFVRSGTIRQSATIPHHHLFANLSTRDHVFLIDDAASMSPHWKDVKLLFRVLAYMVKRSTPDGVELRFTIGKSYYRSRKSAELVEKLNSIHPAGESDIRISLNSILRSHAHDTQKQNYGKTPWDKRKDQSPRRPLNLYVFTDGVWQPDCNVEESIRAFVKKFLQLNIPPGDIGIQFIRFGNDPAKKKLFDHLNLGLNLGMDIVDTEPHNGNVWKMLLGAINTWFDDDDGETRVDNGEGPSGPPA